MYTEGRGRGYIHRYSTRLYYCSACLGTPYGITLGHFTGGVWISYAKLEGRVPRLVDFIGTPYNIWHSRILDIKHVPR